MSATEIGAWLRAQRAPERMSQADLARLLGRSRSWLSSMEQGMFRPRAEDCLRLAAIFDVEPDEVLRRAGYSPEEMTLLGADRSIRVVVVGVDDLTRLIRDAIQEALATGPGADYVEVGPENGR